MLLREGIDLIGAPQQGFGESREVLIPVLLNQMWRQEEVTSTAPLQVLLETREDCSPEEKKSFVLHLYH